MSSKLKMAKVGGVLKTPKTNKRHTTWNQLNKEHESLKKQYDRLSELYDKMDDELVQLRGN
tara:strand:- start:261 stop:443 length:183 start_codon:yes stop_codon:yes gene_type:complete